MRARGERGERLKHKTCTRTGNKRYHDEAEAKRALGNVRAALANRSLLDTGARPVRSYRCEYCGDWHLTNRPERTTLDHPASS